MTVMTWITSKGFNSLQRLAVSMYEFKSDIQREEEVELMRRVCNVKL
jgi:hypothetical protein